MSDINLVKLNEKSLLDYVTGRLGPHDHKSGDNYFWHSPFRSESTASFSVNVEKNRWKDFGATDSSGSLIDYILMEQYGSCESPTRLQLIEVNRILTGEVILPVFAKPVSGMAGNDASPARVTPEKFAETMLTERKPVHEYFVTRHIAEDTADIRKLGMWSRPHYYKLLDGKQFSTKVNAYTIPWFVGTRVVGINQRRDDVDAKFRMSLMDPEDLFDIRLDIAARWTTRDKGTKFWKAEEVSDSHVLDKLYGPKYSKVAGSDAAVFNANRLLKLNDKGDPIMKDGKFTIARHMCCFITESEVCAMALEDEGYNAVAIHSSNKKLEGIRMLFGGVVMPLIVQDNDEPGKEKAQAMWHVFKNGRVLSPFKEYKDVNEMAVAGRIQEWVQSFKFKYSPSLGINPKWA